jgi:hypothetical protein
LGYWKTASTGGGGAGSQTSYFNSAGANDGYVVEATEKSNKGKQVNSTSGVIIVGDDGKNKQYRGFLSFDTSALPDTATITSMTLSIKQNGVVGSDPFATHGNLQVDIKNNIFGKKVFLEKTDFQASASGSSVAIFDPALISGWYSATFNSSSFGYINRTGITQFRLRFALDDDNDRISDYVSLFSGNAALADQPMLIIQYTTP